MCNGSELEKLRAENAKFILEIELLKKLALTDALTGLGNRYIFDDELKRKVKRYARSIFSNFIADDDNFSLILFDLDKFKSVNDTFGTQRW